MNMALGEHGEPCSPNATVKPKESKYGETGNRF